MSNLAPSQWTYTKSHPTHKLITKKILNHPMALVSRHPNKECCFKFCSNGASPFFRYTVEQTIAPHTLLHKLVGLHDTVGSVRLQSDNKAVQYSLINHCHLNVMRVCPYLLHITIILVKATAAAMLSLVHSQPPTSTLLAQLPLVESQGCPEKADRGDQLLPRQPGLPPSPAPGSTV
jgi:hypothetical protein